VQEQRQCEIIKQLNIARSSGNQNAEEITSAVMKVLAEQNGIIGI
jgi:hypothetical protein